MSIASFIGFSLGAAIPVALIYVLSLKTLAKRMAAGPRIITAILTAWVVGSILGAFGMADGGSPQYAAGAIAYALPTLLVLCIDLLRRKLKRSKKEEPAGKA